MNKKICFVTGSRAEYGLLYPLMIRLKSERLFKLQIIATGMHLSLDFGSTYKDIEKDGFRIDEKVRMPLSSDRETDIIKSMGIGLCGLADAFNKLKPDLVILLGDRFEIFSAAIASFIAKIPIAHIHGGELTEGSMDDAIRHSITKMSMLHFVCTEDYKRRVIQLGEPPERVFNVGALGIDNIKSLDLIDRKNLERELKFEFRKGTVLVTFHPPALERGVIAFQFKELLKALDGLNLRVIFTRPNADPGGRVIFRLIDDYTKRNPEKSVSFISLGRVKYLSAVKYVDAVIGNSSSAIIEAPSLGKPAVNIGDRQKGRIKAASVIDCNPTAQEITRALKKALSLEFLEYCRRIKNPYGNGNAADSICRILKRHINSIKGINKKFYDMEAR